MAIAHSVLSIDNITPVWGNLQILNLVVKVLNLHECDVKHFVKKKQKHNYKKNKYQKAHQSTVPK